MKIIIAKNSGFCYGVKKAIKKAYASKKLYKNEKIYTLGPLIHNQYEVETLNKNNIISISEKEIKTIPYKKPIIIRCHGVGKSFFEAYKHNYNIINATCSMVINAQKLGNEYYNKGYKVVVVGNKNHPEVKGILDWSGNDSIAISSVIEAKNIISKKPILLISQTTQTDKLFNLIKNILIKKNIKNIFKNTICKSTRDRQSEIINLSKNVDLILIIGSKLSSNTNKLYEIAKENNKESYIIENENSLIQKKIYKNKNIIGIASGASTPKWLINKIIKIIKNIKE